MSIFSPLAAFLPAAKTASKIAGGVLAPSFGATLAPGMAGAGEAASSSAAAPTSDLLSGLPLSKPGGAPSVLSPLATPGPTGHSVLGQRLRLANNMLGKVQQGMQGPQRSGGGGDNEGGRVAQGMNADNSGIMNMMGRFGDVFGRPGISGISSDQSPAMQFLAGL